MQLYVGKAALPLFVIWVNSNEYKLKQCVCVCVLGYKNSVAFPCQHTNYSITGLHRDTNERPCWAKVLDQRHVIFLVCLKQLFNISHNTSNDCVMWNTSLTDHRCKRRPSALATLSSLFWFSVFTIFPAPDSRQKVLVTSWWHPKWAAKGPAVISLRSCCLLTRPTHGRIQRRGHRDSSLTEFWNNKYYMNE